MKRYSPQLSVLFVAAIFSALTSAQHHEHHQHKHHAMTLDRNGMVMNANASTLPDDCENISETYVIEVEAGASHAKKFADRSFAYSEHEFRVKPCSLLQVRFSNADKVRHQWMVHGLPRYLYPQGMFHLEAAGGQTVEGSFIVPSDHQTYLVHCDIAQHMEKGMKAQLVVGRGSGDLWSVPGQTDALVVADGGSRPYPKLNWPLLFGAAAVAAVLGLLKIGAKTTERKR